MEEQRDVNSKHLSAPSSSANQLPRRRRACRNRRRRRKASSKASTASNIDGGNGARRKLFVGQLPPNISDHQLRPLFAEFGRIIQLKIRRDEDTGDSYGLVTYDRSVSAQKARKMLHNSVQLPGTRRPLQVNFVDHLANYRKRKLFVGRISRHLTDTDVLSMFASFGDIEDCCVIRQPFTGHSEGCAFVTFADKKAAAAAICCLHGSQVMHGWTSSMVVRLADSRMTKRLKQLG